MEYVRLNHDADSEEEIRQYYKDRSKQLAFYGFHWCEIILPFEEVGYYTVFTKEDTQKPYISFYIKKSQRFKSGFLRFLRQFWEQLPDNERPDFITVPDCKLEAFFNARKIPYLSLGEGLHFKSYAYKLISLYYGNQRAKRSGVPYMYHIDEGLIVMKSLNFSVEAMNAFCLHPLFQNDEDLMKGGMKALSLVNIPRKELMLAMEYRNIANAYLAHHYTESYLNIALSPMVEVNQMLIADKIQNYKDLIYYNTNHPKFVSLTVYFQNWFKRLNIDADLLRSCISRIK